MSHSRPDCQAPSGLILMTGIIKTDFCIFFFIIAGLDDYYLEIYALNGNFGCLDTKVWDNRGKTHCGLEKKKISREVPKGNQTVLQGVAPKVSLIIQKPPEESFSRKPFTFSDIPVNKSKR